MKGKLTFLIIPSSTGRRRSFSMSRNFLACMVLLCLALAGAGIWGTMKYEENQTLKKKCARLEIEKNKFEAVSRRMQHIEKDGDTVRKLLGLQASGGEDSRMPPQQAEEPGQE